MRDPGLRRRRPSNVAERLANLEAEVLTDTITAFRRISLDVTIAKIADLTAGKLKIVGPEGSNSIDIDATEEISFIQSSNFEENTEGFRIRADGQVEINEGLIVGTGSEQGSAITIKPSLQTISTSHGHIQFDMFDTTNHWVLYTSPPHSIVDGLIDETESYSMNLLYKIGNTEDVHISSRPARVIGALELFSQGEITAGTSGNEIGFKQNLQTGRVEFGSIITGGGFITTRTIDNQLYTTLFDILEILYNTSTRIFKLKWYIRHYRGDHLTGTPVQWSSISTTIPEPTVQNFLARYSSRGSWKLTVRTTDFIQSTVTISDNTLTWNNITSNPFSTDGRTTVELFLPTALQSLSARTQIPYLESYAEMYHNNTKRTGKAKIFVGNSAPTGPKAVGDIWVDTS